MPLAGELGIDRRSKTVLLAPMRRAFRRTLFPACSGRCESHLVQPQFPARYAREPGQPPPARGGNARGCPEIRPQRAAFGERAHLARLALGARLSRKLGIFVGGPGASAGLGSALSAPSALVARSTRALALESAAKRTRLRSVTLQIAIRLRRARPYRLRVGSVGDVFREEQSGPPIRRVLLRGLNC